MSLGKDCVYVETLRQRRRLAAEHTAWELGESRRLHDNLVRALRAEDKSLALKLFENIRNNGTAEDLCSHVDETLELGVGNGRELEQTNSNLRELRSIDRQESMQPARPQVMNVDYLCVQPPFRVPAKPWTSVSTDPDIVSHLVSLWLTWDYPFHAFLDREVFLKHMRAGDLNSEFCSPFLVNALLAVACVS